MGVWIMVSLFLSLVFFVGIYVEVEFLIFAISIDLKGVVRFLFTEQEEDDL